MSISKAEVNEVAKELISLVKEMNPGARTTVAHLVSAIRPDLLEEDSGVVMFDEPIDQATDSFFDLSYDEPDLMLDMSEHDGKDVGRLYNLPFIVRKRIPEHSSDPNKMLDKLEWFRFSIGGYLDGHTDICLRKDASGNFVFQDDLYEYLSPEKYDIYSKVPNEQVGHLKRALREANVLGWDSNYWAHVMDGTQWELDMRFEDGTFFESGGSNNYPKGFNALIEELIDLGLSIDFYDYEADATDNSDLIL